MISFKDKFMWFGIPALLIFAGIYAFYLGIIESETKPILMGLLALTMATLTLITATMSEKRLRVAQKRLSIELPKRGITEANLPKIEEFLYQQAAKGIALVTRMYLQNHVIPDSEGLFTIDAYKGIKNGLANLDNPIYNSIKGFANKQIGIKYNNLSMESMEEFHMNYLLNHKETVQVLDPKGNVLINGYPINVPLLSGYQEHRVFSKPEGRIFDIEGNTLLFTIVYNVKDRNAGQTETNSEIEEITFDITEIKNPKIISISNNYQINNIFALSVVKS